MNKQVKRRLLGEMVSFSGSGTPSKKEKSNWGGKYLWMSPKAMEVA